MDMRVTEATDEQYKPPAPATRLTTTKTPAPSSREGIYRH